MSQYANVLLDPMQKKESFYEQKTKLFNINRHLKEGVFIYANKMIRDQDLFDFLLTVTEETIAKFSITNAEISDAGIVILAEFFSLQSSLSVLKLYNNIMHAILNGNEVPYLLSGTLALANCIEQNPKL